MNTTKRLVRVRAYFILYFFLSQEELFIISQLKESE